MWPRMCPRCGGDLILREETDGVEIACVQCSRVYSSDALLRQSAQQRRVRNEEADELAAAGSAAREREPEREREKERAA